jgi:ATP-dependent DNA helicase PIF1
MERTTYTSANIDTSPITDTSVTVDQILKSTRNYLIHGPGGTGKSHLIKELFKWARISEIDVYCTATTGVAAVGIGGTTFHRWAGIGLADSSKEMLLHRVKSNAGAKKRIKNTDLLIIDEISMMSAEVFDKVDYICRNIRGVDKPLGGLRVVLCGDFLQLPPVVKGMHGKANAWVFNSAAYKALDLVCIKLTKYMRFIDDKYAAMLSRLRTADPTEDDLMMLLDRVNAYRDVYCDKQCDMHRDSSSGVDEIEPTILFSHRDDAAVYNLRRMNELTTPEHTFIAEDCVFNKRTKSTENGELQSYKKILDDAADEVLTLRVGANVMLRCNLDIEQGLVNGSRGVVVEIKERIISDVFDPELGMYVKTVVQAGGCRVRFVNGAERMIEHFTWDMDEGDITFSRRQIPLILAYAMTIHKTQGCTLDRVICDLSKIFECAQIYVALSRVRSLKGLYIMGIDFEKIMADSTAVKYVASL